MRPVSKNDHQNKKPDKTNYSEVFGDEFLKKFIQTLPNVTAILNEQKKIILANQIRLEGEKDLSVEEFFGQNPGAALNCIHANNPYSQCHPEGVCKFCGVPNALLQAQKEGKKVVQETNITIQLDDQSHRSYDVELHAAPFPYKKRHYILLTIIDISEQKRKRALERIFFHDVINKIGSLKNILELLTDDDYDEDNAELIELSQDVVKDLNEEILQQKNLMAAESGDLKIEPTIVNTMDIIKESIQQLVQYPESQNITIEADKNAASVEFKTDPVILKRIIINMLKNAIEASKSSQNVYLGCNDESENVTFWVKNQAYIPEQNQIKIFDRTFSTKGKDRGLGTYSMKILGEEYLNGKVSFTSDQKEGTVFYINLFKDI
jgi:signal transduction histidine kinase